MNIPGFLTDFNSFQNPILSGFVTNINRFNDAGQEDHRTVPLRLGGQQHTGMIDPEILKKYGGKETSLSKDDVIFRADEEALNYFQIVKGSVKMITDSPEGKEFIQGIFKANDSFGEPPLFCSFLYPSTAVALEPTTIIKLSKERFFTLLRENFEIHLHLDKVLCERLKYKSMVLSEISFYDPEHRIMSLLKYFKGGSADDRRSARTAKTESDFIVPFTRQQIADMSGLRVETVIRTVKKMENDGKLRVVSRKIAF